jgi:hypothetical protein
MLCVNSYKQDYIDECHSSGCEYLHHPSVKAGSSRV